MPSVTSNCFCVSFAMGFKLLFVFISSLQLNLFFVQYTYSLVYPHILRNWSLVSRMSCSAFEKTNPMLLEERNQLQATSTKSNMIFLSLLYYLVRNDSMPKAWGWSSKKSQATLVPLWVCAFIMLSLHLHVHEYRCVTFTCHSPCVDISREPQVPGFTFCMV